MDEQVAVVPIGQAEHAIHRQACQGTDDDV